jgi:hypothetical protein
VRVARREPFAGHFGANLLTAPNDLPLPTIEPPHDELDELRMPRTKRGVEG